MATVGLTRDQKLEIIVSMMERGEWVRGRSATAMAREWGDSESTVRNYSAEASRLLAREIQNVDHVKEDVSVLMRQATELALASGKYGDAARCADVLTRILGARAPERQEVSTMTPEQAAAVWRKHTGKDWSPE